MVYCVGTSARYGVARIGVRDASGSTAGNDGAVELLRQ
jgi:hypothetical protein